MKSFNRYFKVYDGRNRLHLVSCVKQNILDKVNELSGLNIALDELELPKGVDRFYSNVRIAVAETINNTYKNGNN